MAIILKSKKYGKIVIDSKMITGVVGEKYDDFLSALCGDNYYFLELNPKVNVSYLDIDSKYKKYFNEEMFGKESDRLSHSEKRLMSYVHMLHQNPKYIIINEPFLDLDFDEKKKIKNLLYNLAKDGKTIIVGSSNINIIYSLCKKVLVINDNEIYYDNINCLNNKIILEKYHLEMPDIVEFIELAKEKNIKIPFSKDIRDLIKDVYRNVSKK